MGRTTSAAGKEREAADFNSLAPCGANRGAPNLTVVTQAFQLTRPVWGEPTSSAISDMLSVISTHSPRVGRTAASAVDKDARGNFNSLAPCGANRNKTSVPDLAERFQLTRPVWGEPSVKNSGIVPLKISTHSPRVGRTRSKTRSKIKNLHFNSLAPCGANHYQSKQKNNNNQFQLTRPVWGEPRQD